MTATSLVAGIRHVLTEEMDRGKSAVMQWTGMLRGTDDGVPRRMALPDGRSVSAVRMTLPDGRGEPGYG